MNSPRRHQGSKRDGLRPIETRYNGYRFRSRLEARWAVFFDALGVAYEYEPQGFALDGTAYLPDFYLRDWGSYAEVKPELRADETLAGAPWWRTAMAFAATGHELLMLLGTPAVAWYPVVQGSWDALVGAPRDPGYEADWVDLGQSVSKGRVWYSFAYGLTERPPFTELSSRWMPEYARAVEAARSARFEHGERPRPVSP